MSKTDQQRKKMTENSTANSTSEYLLTMLLQRLEVSQPGLIEELIDGVNADNKGIHHYGRSSDHTENTIKDALTILHRAAST